MGRVRSLSARFVSRTHQASHSRENRKMIRKIVAALGITAAIALASAGIAGAFSAATTQASGTVLAVAAGTPWGAVPAGTPWGAVPAGTPWG